VAYFASSNSKSLSSSFLYIGPGLGVGAAVLIVLILVLIAFSFGYRLWYSLVKAPKFISEPTKNKPSASSLSWGFYAPLFTALGIIVTFNPLLIGAKSSGKYNSNLQGLPLWVAVLVAIIIGASLFYVLRGNRKVKGNKFSSLRNSLYSLSFSPLNRLLLCSVFGGIALPFLEPASVEILSTLKGSRALAYSFGVGAGLLLGQSILWMKNLFFETATTSVALLNVLVAPSNDTTKITAMNDASSKTTVALLKLLGSLIIVVLDVYALGWSLPKILLEGLFSSGWAIISVSVGSFVPFLFKKKSNRAYSELSQLFHRLVLDNYHIGRKLLASQIKNVGTEAYFKGRYSRVLITGLARSGTTALTKELAKRGPFASLDYSNMPVLLAPRLWAKLYKPRRKNESTERAHGDGVKVGLASVEALEEYFFKVLKNDTYITEDGLLEHLLTQEENDLYRRYQNSIAGEEVYLAKNNNALLRLKSLLQLNSDLAVFMLIRHPLQHAYSLMVQHERFCDQQKTDPFVREYMDWLGHHEFGEGERPFIFNGKGGQSDQVKDLNYWLERWVNYYSQVETQDNLFLIRYEDFLQNPKGVLNLFQSKLSITLNYNEIKVFNKNDKLVEATNHELLAQASAIYSNLSKLCLKPF
jgi:hypothetical protein